MAAILKSMTLKPLATKEITLPVAGDGLQFAVIRKASGTPDTYYAIVALFAFEKDANDYIREHLNPTTDFEVRLVA